MVSLCERGARGRLEGVDGSLRSSEVEMGSRCSSSPLNWDMIPSSREFQPGELSTAWWSVDMRSGLGLGDPPAAMAFLSSASLTLMLLRLLLLGARMGFSGRPLTVCVGEGDRDRWSDGLLTKIIDWSSEMSVPTERRSLWLMAGRGLSVEARGGAVNTSVTSTDAGMRDAWALGNGGTGGGKASKSGELEYVAMDAEDGEEVSVFWSQQRVRFRQ